MDRQLPNSDLSIDGQVNSCKVSPKDGYLNVRTLILEKSDVFQINDDDCLLEVYVIQFISVSSFSFQLFRLPLTHGIRESYIHHFMNGLKRQALALIQGIETEM